MNFKHLKFLNILIFILQSIILVLSRAKIHVAGMNKTWVHPRACSAKAPRSKKCCMHERGRREPAVLAQTQRKIHVASMKGAM